MFSNKKQRRKITEGIRIVSLATAVRWFGFGLVEAVMPVFLASFAGNYFELGLIGSAFDAVFILSLPFAGLLADRVASRAVMLSGLFIYPVVGVGYFLAGYTGLTKLAIASLTLNGFCCALDTVGRDTYFRRNSPKNKISSTFGYFDSITNSWWLFALVFGALLSVKIKIHFLFLAVIPTSLAAILLVWRLRPDKNTNLKSGIKKALTGKFFLSSLRELKKMEGRLKNISLLAFFIGLASSFSTFFLPVYSYSQGASIWQVALLAVFVSLPSLFGRQLGKIADKLKNKALFLGLSVSSALFFSFIWTENFRSRLILSLFLGIFLKLADLAGEGILIKLVNKENCGRLSVVMEELSDLGGLLGPIFFGLTMDRLGPSYSFMLVSFTAGLVFLYFWRDRKILVPARQRI